MLELPGAIAGIDEMGMAIDEAGRGEAAVESSPHVLPVLLGSRADPGDAPFGDRDRAIFDRAIARLMVAALRLVTRIPTSLFV